MALSDFWQIKDNQIFRGKPILNVYHAIRIDVGANAQLVGEAFLDQVVAGPTQNIQPDALTRTTIEVENLSTATDFAVLDSSAFPGLLVGQDLPSFNAATIQFNRTRNDMKNGTKRILAGGEVEQQDGGWSSGFQTLLNTYALNVFTAWERDVAPGVLVCSYVILKRFCVVPAQSPCLQYRLPNTDAEADGNNYVPTSATVRSRVRSQVSRKILL